MTSVARTTFSRLRQTVGRAILATAATTCLAAAAPVQTASSDAEDLAFLAENAPAMNRMMAGMEITTSHDVDRDFVAMMIPHHQGGIDMAVSELRHGRNEQLRRIAQEIIVDQQQEIVAMRLAVGQSLPQSAPAPTASEPMQMPMTH
jgi:uncharacterized protein (DUF305 family)